VKARHQSDLRLPAFRRGVDIRFPIITVLAVVLMAAPSLASAWASLTSRAARIEWMCADRIRWERKAALSEKWMAVSSREFHIRARKCASPVTIDSGSATRRSPVPRAESYR
jgi:hypothetical protein